MYDLLDLMAQALETHLMAAALVFVRVGAIAALLPGFGEMFLPARVRLAVAATLTLTCYPAIDRTGLPAGFEPLAFAALALTEAAVGLLIGLSLRLVVMALQYAGSIAAQTTSLAQFAAGSVAPDPMPAIGNTLLIAGLTLAMISGLHVKIVIAVIDSYQVLGFGAALPGGDVALWGIAQGRAAFGLAFTLAAPFVVAAFLYNIGLGVINRAMPQLMVAFVGAPAITGVTLLILMFSAAVILATWHGRLDEVLVAPLGTR